ncbi:MAG: hypothetical protein LiPW30_495 [Parcubacteria group bacterium LiPW_30]|nr:MAG: hypothetical protein LiPW30_495 [Parcubacteria group bacterium LiPW_30]
MRNNTSVFVLTSFIFIFSAFGLSASAVTLPTVDSLINDTASQIYVDRDGHAIIGGVKVTQVAGVTYFSRLIWGESFIRLTVKTNSKTKFANKFGEPISAKELKEGDILVVEGELESASQTMTIIPRTVRNISNQTENNEFSGTVSNIRFDSDTFTLTTKTKGPITISVNNGTTTEIKKGSRIINLSSLRSGDKVTKVDGVLNHATNQMVAKNIVVYVDMNTFKPRNFQGVIKEISGATLPLNFTATIGGADYLVKLNEKTTILNNLKNSAKLSRFEAGDRVRFYGAIEESDSLIVGKVEVLRNLDL